jgi:hypothetical protein
LFGYSVSLGSNISIVAIGAFANDGNGEDSGHVCVFDLNNVLSLDDLVQSQFNLYPNPTKAQFTIQLENTTELENVIIYNNLGQEVLTSKKNILIIYGYKLVLIYKERCLEIALVKRFLCLVMVI